MRVYFLGAGASKSLYPGSPNSSPTRSWRLGLPTASELSLNHLFSAPNYESPPFCAIESLRSFACLQKLGPTPLQKPIEDVLDIFEGHDDQFRNLRICLVRRLWVRDTMNTGPLVKWLHLVRKTGAVLITTNYDTVLERGIAKLTKPIDPRHLTDRGFIDYGIEPDVLLQEYQGVARGASPKSIHLLKLHGSVSWGYCNMCQKAAMDPVYRSLAEDTLSDAATCLSPILVGPAKKLYDHPIIERIFRSAKEALGQAEEIVFAGFSLSTSDERIRELLASPLWSCLRSSSPQRWSRSRPAWAKTFRT
jgi:SIR2-like domain